MDQTPDQQEVLIARDNESGQVGAFIGQNPDGTPKVADVKSTPLSELIKFNKNQNPIEAFMSNFIRQAKNPTLFSFFKLQEDKYELVGPAMADIIRNPGDNADMLKPYEVEMKAPEQIEKQEQSPSQTPPAQEQNVEQAPSNGIRKAPIDPDSIDWAKIEQQWGIKRDDFEKSGALDQMVYNHKSPQLFTVTPQFGDEKFSLQAKLSFRTNSDGSYSLAPQLHLAVYLGKLLDAGIDHELLTDVTKKFRYFGNALPFFGKGTGCGEAFLGEPHDKVFLSQAGINIL